MASSGNKTQATSQMIVKKHLKPARKADMRRAATLPTTGKRHWSR